MASYNELLALIDAYINRNGVQAITGQILNGVLKAMVDQLGRGYTLMGYAEPTGDPGTPDGPESWFASVPGTYTNYGGIQVAAGELALLSFSPSDGWAKNTIYEGFREVTADIDGNVGTPEVGVSYANGVLSFDFRNMKGNPGEDGDPAGFGSVTASVDDQVGTPSVSVSSSGPDTAKNFAFAFHNLKGETGVTSVLATVDNTSGNPQCSVSLQGGQLTLAFTGLKGAQGNTGSSVDYPFTIVNNLTTNDPAQALSAAMGVELDGKVSQLELKVDGNVTDGYYYNNLGTAVAGEGWCISGKIPVNAGDTITYIPGTKWATAHIVIFNASNSRLDYYNANADSRNITLPANSAYVLASFSYKSGAGIKIGDDFIFTPSIGMKVPLEEVVAKLGTDAQIGKAYSTTGNALIDKDGWMVVNVKVVPGDSVVYNAGKAESPCGIGVFSASGARNDYYSASASDRTITISGSSTYIQASVAVGTAYKLTINGKSVFGLVLDVRNNKVAIDALASAQGKMSDAVSYDFSGILKPYKAVVIGTLGVGDTLDINNNVNSDAWFGGILPCKAGDTFKISDAWGGSTVAPYVFVDSAYKILAFVTGAITTEVTVVAPTNTAYIVCSANNPDSTPHNYKYVLLYGIATHFDELENEINGTFDTVPLSPVYVRKEAKDGTSFNANVKLYPEGFMTEMGQHLRLNNAREWSPINLMMNATHRETTQTLSVEVAKGGKRKNVSVPVRRVNQGLVTGKTAFLLCVGESTTDGSIDDPTLYDGTRHFSKFWGYPSALQYFALMDEAYYQNGNDIRTIGHKSNLGLTFQYNGQTLTNRSFCVGYGGHATYWLLNYPLQMQTTASANIISAKDLWYFLGLATKTPYDQATYNEDVETWANDAAHWALMTQTPAGKYKVDGCEELWNKIRDHASSVCAGTTIPSTSITGSYTGSAEQLAALNAWAEEVFANPENPFFDIDVARDGVTDCAFSLDKYLERYRTMDDAGNRLVGSAGQTVVGGDGETYTIGTRVSNTADWDVCTPTHIIFNIGINDNVNNSVVNTVANVKQLVGRVSVPVGYFVCRYGGVANSGQWEDVGTVEEVSLSAYNAQMVSDLTDWFANNEVNGKYLLPIWQTMYPASSDTWCKEEDVLGNPKFLYETAIHTGYFGYKSIGLECLSWLYYLITSATQF